MIIYNELNLIDKQKFSSFGTNCKLLKNDHKN